MIDFNTSDLDESGKIFIENISKLKWPEMFEAVRRLKIDVERARMENLWMKEFLRENEPKIDAKKRHITFQAESISVIAIKLQSFSAAAQPRVNLDPVIKKNLCEQQIFRMEREMIEKQNQSFKDMKRIVAETKESEITLVEFDNIIKEFKKKILEENADRKSNQHASQNFIDETARNCAAFGTSIRMKTETMKGEYRKQHILVKKREELSSNLQPIDFELVLLEKEKFKKIEEEKKSLYNGLKHDENLMAYKKNTEQKDFLNARIKLKEITKKIKFSELNIETMKRKVENLENEIVEIKESSRKLEEQNSIYNAPSVTDYIDITDEREKLKSKLKALERKNGLIKNSLKIAKKKLRIFKEKSSKRKKK